MKLCHFELSEKYCIIYCTNIIKIYSCDRNEKLQITDFLGNSLV